jgi:hypothetical protein
MSPNNEAENKPYINVTPLIDVLLVLLIIFMVAAPLRPSRFVAKLPSVPGPAFDAPGFLWNLGLSLKYDARLTEHLPGFFFHPLESQ